MGLFSIRKVGCRAILLFSGEKTLFRFLYIHNLSLILTSFFFTSMFRYHRIY